MQPTELPSGKMNLATYQEIWKKVREAYDKGYVVSERGLLAALYKEFTPAFPHVNMVVEPYWQAQGKIPDIVVVDNESIIDIFELKYVPHHYPVFEDDIRKLASYVEGDEWFSVAIDPKTGQWQDYLQVSPDCRLHFVVVGDPEAAALYTKDIKKHLRHLKHLERPLRHALKHTLYHWKGPSGQERIWEVDRIVGEKEKANGGRRGA